MAAGASGNTTDFTAKLAAARAALAKLDDDDPRKTTMRSWLADIDQRLQSGGGRVPKQPDKRRDFVGLDESDPHHNARIEAFNAIVALLAAWPRVTNSEKQHRKRQKKLHAQAEQATREAAAVSTASMAQSSTQPLNTPMLHHASGARLSL